MNYNRGIAKRAYDACVIGGGLIGASIALELASPGQRVVVLDRGEPGREASWAAAGMLSPGIERADEQAGAALVPLMKESLRLYPEFVAAVEQGSRRKVNFAGDGALELFFGSAAESERDRFVAEHQRLALPAEAVEHAQARQLEALLAPGAKAAWLPYEATVEPRALTAATIEAAANRGAEIRAYTPATALLMDAGKCEGVRAGGEEIRAKWTVLAAGCFSREFLRQSLPTNHPSDALQRGFSPREESASAKNPAESTDIVYPVRGQMLALRPRNATLRRVLRSDSGYVVPRRDGSVVAGSTLERAGFDKHVTAAGLRKILDAAILLAPSLESAEVIESWAGLRPGTPDALPILGPCETPGVLFATGHYRNGILLAPVTATLLREWITEGKTSFAADAFAPARFRVEMANSRRSGRV